MNHLRRAIPLVLLAASLPLAQACGSDGGENNPPDKADAAVVILPPDAAIPDAAPPPPDARPVDLSCADDPEPTEPAAATIKISGVLRTVNVQTQSLDGVADAAVSVFASSDDATAVATGTTNAQGAFEISVTTGGTPFVGYVSVKKDTLLPTYLFFADPLRADTVGAQMATMPIALYEQIGGLAGIEPGDGFIAVRTEDCSSFGINSADVSVEPSDASTQAQPLGALLPQLEGGTGILNVPVVDAKATPVTVKANLNAGEVNLQDAPIKVFPDSFSYIVVHP